MNNDNYLARSPLGDTVRFHTYGAASQFCDEQNQTDGPLLAWHAFESVCFLAGRTILPVATIGKMARHWTVINDGGAK
jgi:hypothetical protein